MENGDRCGGEERYASARGVDFIKVQDAIPHDVYAAVANEAHREHMSCGIFPGVGSYTFARMAFLICLILASSRL